MSRSSLLMLVALGALACGEQGKAPEAASSAAVPVTAAPATAAQAAATVGPDGPDTIALPATLGGGDVKKGEELFTSKGCKACHNVDATRLVGPGLQGVSGRRSEKWLARMILKPEQMVKDDPEAKKLFATYMTPMANQNVDPAAELPHLLAFLGSKK